MGNMNRSNKIEDLDQHAIILLTDVETIWSVNTGVINRTNFVKLQEGVDDSDRVAGGAGVN